MKLKMMIGFFYFLLNIELLASQVPLSVMSYNIKGVPIATGRYKRTEQIASLLPRSGADVIGIQEAFMESSKLLEQIESYPYVVRLPVVSNLETGKWSKTGSGLMFLSKYPIVESDFHRFEHCKGFDCLAKKGVLYAKVRHPEIGNVKFFVTHLNMNVSKKVIWSQIEETLSFIAKKAINSQDLIFLMGDFNIRPNDRHHVFLSTKANMVDSKLSAPKMDLNELYGHLSEKDRNNILRKNDQHFDYIFYFKNNEHRIFNKKTRWMYFEESLPRKLSDHYALISHFLISK